MTTDVPDCINRGLRKSSPVEFTPHCCAEAQILQTGSQLAKPGDSANLRRDLKGRRCVLDGEIVCLDPEGKTQFRDLLFRRAEPDNA